MKRALTYFSLGPPEKADPALKIGKRKKIII